MERFIPFEKLSKQKKREILAKRRKTWEGLNPVTRKPVNPKAYRRSDARQSEAQREKTRRWDDDSSDVSFIFANLRQ